MQTRKDRELDEAAKLIETLMDQNDKLRARLADRPKTVLVDALEEEFDRCKRHREAILAEMEDPGTSPEKRKHLDAILQRIGSDMRRLERALEPEDAEPVLRAGGLRDTYDTIMALHRKLQAEVISAAGELLDRPYLAPEGLDYRKVKALAATYELQEYLANAIAAAVDSGELAPDPED